MSSATQPAYGAQPIRVLLAQPDLISRSHISELLDRSGYDVTVVTGGRQALEALQTDCAPSLAVLDCNLPGISAPEICRILRQSGRRNHTYLLLLTSWSATKQRIEALEAGADDCLYVPVDVRELCARLATGARAMYDRNEAELFLRSIPSVLIGLDMQGCIIRWNPAAAAALGLPGEQLQGRSLADCGVKWTHADMKEEIQSWLKARAFHRCDPLAFERDGRLRFLGLDIFPIPEPGGGRLAFLATGADITDRLALEEQLRQAQKLEAIGQLAAGIAHEVNTPTQYVGDNTRFLQDSWQSIAQLLEFCLAIRAEAAQGAIAPASFARFDQLVTQCDLDYLIKEIPHAIDQSLEGLQRVAKIVRGMKEFSHPGAEEKRAIDINRAIETTITVARHEWKYVAEVVTHFDAALPLVPCLAGEFNQVILNLIVNAAQAITLAIGSDEKRRGAITITTHREQNWAQISIADTGPGIPPEIRNRIFEPFFTTKPVGKGTGQGLALAHSVIVNRHQGQLWFETEVGAGATFFIRLPLDPDAPPDEKGPPL